MIRQRNGFTLVEVALFLAVTGMLFVGITVGTQNTITQQRFTDSVQNFAEFLRSVYSQVSNPQSVSAGRSETHAIYGKLIVFGENTGLDGENLSLGINSDGSQKIYTYDVIGDVSGTGSGEIKQLLIDRGVNAIVATQDSSTRLYHADPAGIAEGYTVRWASTIERARAINDPDTVSHDLYTGSILIVRHPRSGTINTLVSRQIIEVNDMIKYINDNPSDRLPANFSSLLTAPLASTSEDSEFTTDEINFCINPYGTNSSTTLRRNIRLTANARNASGVEIIDLDSEDNLCR